jgi:hypothetical protein
MWRSKQRKSLTFSPLGSEWAVVLLTSLFAIGGAYGQENRSCGTLKNAYGPFDYRTATREQKDLVETFHFTPDVESLKRGASGAYPGHDIDYTLRAYPNHARALASMSRLMEREKREKPTGAKYSVQCYFERALQFQPDDGAVRGVYGYHLLRQGDRQGAIREMLMAIEFGGGTSSVHYNLGLAYFDLGDFPSSLHHAKRAYALGFPLPGLRDKLRKLGKWED